MTVFSIPYHLNAQEAIFRQEGIASWYGREYDGRQTASGEIFDSSKLTAAHPNLPFGTRLVVTNTHNNKSVVVIVNDRGPFVPARIIDISRAAAEQLDMIITGTAPVIIESIDRVALVPPAAEQVQTPSAGSFAANTINVSQPVIVQTPQLRLVPEINIVPNKTYRLQIGSYRIDRNAIDAFDRLKNQGLNPAYERYENGGSEYYRVVLAGIRGTDVQLTAERISAAGFREVLIREEN